MDSEIELNDIIQDMHVSATRPDLYHLLLQTNCMQTLLGLLSHENTGKKKKSFLFPSSAYKSLTTIRYFCECYKFVARIN
jgi:hypothetical protein